MNKVNPENWRNESRPAMHWHKDGEKTTCTLCPRNCSLKTNQKGFCQVRGNVDGALNTYNYGISVQATIENIETEAVNHYMPGAKILSMGNVGCMMACSYCQNWQTSQVKYLNDKNVHCYSPQEVIDLAIKNDIQIISWTYNDPVVWHEFVLDTSKLAKEHGIKTLYKSALYIEEKPLAELIEVIDIFSVSLKGMDPVMYKKHTKGELAPVLERMKEISKSDKHLEVSQLVVTELNDNGEDIIKTAKWMLQNLREKIPLHLVAYHPAFRYNKERTSIDTLLKLRKLALKEGIEYCYLGNVYADDLSNTYCTDCNSKLIQRFGLSVKNVGLNEKSECRTCEKLSPISHPIETKDMLIFDDFKPTIEENLVWNKEMNSIHIVIEDNKSDSYIKIERKPGNTTELHRISNGLERIIFSKSSESETGIHVSIQTEHEIQILPVLDRAHFPVKNESTASNKYLN
jgi:pyruvate formate lyase activating enzyme